MPSSAPPPHGTPPENPDRRELRDALLTFGPAILAAFVLRWALVENVGWAPRRALLASIAVGIVLALTLQRAIRRERP